MSGGKPLKAKKGLSGGKPLAKRSVKTTEKYVARRALVSNMLEDRPLCEACRLYAAFDNRLTSVNDAVDIHEVVLRSQGGDILDASICMPVCRPCHMRVDEDREVAMLVGLYVPSFAYTDDGVTEARYLRMAIEVGAPFVPSYYRG